MLHLPQSFSRREFLQASSAAISTAACWPPGAAQAAVQRRPRVAALITVLRFRSHPYNILENFLGPYYFRGQWTDPGVEVVSLYADQFPHDDMAREASRRFHLPLYPSIREAMCVGGKKLAVDAVLSIGEHGEYPYNARGQHEYPRKRFFDEAFAVMQESGRFTPFFNDKHLSYRWDWAKEMYDTAREHGMPLLAGSSVPLAQRRPPLELPHGAEIEEAVSVHGGGLESYDFHAIEVLQSIVASRRGGESGVSQVELLTGDAYKNALQKKRWSQDLVDAAMQAEEAMHAVRQPFPKVGAYAKKKTPKKTSEKKKGASSPPQQPSGPYAIVVTYKDGLRATVLRIGGNSNRWNFACRLKGETQPRATAFFNGPWGNRCLFKALSHAIQHLFRTGQEPYPAERTLLTTGVVEAVMRSREQQGKPVQTPHLEIAYQANDFTSFRENGETWKIITKDTPQPTAFQPRAWSELKK